MAGNCGSRIKLQAANVNVSTFSGGWMMATVRSLFVDWDVPLAIDNDIFSIATRIIKLFEK